MSDEVLVEWYADSAPEDPESVERATLDLRRELLDLDPVAGVRPAPAGPAPPGTRGLDVAALGALLVSVKPTAEILGKVVDIVRSWLRRRRDGDRQVMRVTVNGHTIELTPTDAQQAALVEAFIARAAAPPA